MFSRKDVLVRHINALHKFPKAKTSRRHACARCAELKLKCSGGEVCETCKKKGVVCQSVAKQTSRDWWRIPSMDLNTGIDVALNLNLNDGGDVCNNNEFDLDPMCITDWLRYDFVESPLNIDYQSTFKSMEPQDMKKKKTEDSWPFSYSKIPETSKVTLPPLSEVICSQDRSMLRTGFTNLLSLPYKSSLWPIQQVTDIEMFFPSSEVVQEFIDLYFSKWYHICPIIHRPSWSLDTAPSLLMAAMISIGAGFSDRPDAHKFADNLSELIKRTIKWHIEKDRRYLRDEFFLTAMLLQSIYALGSGHKGLFEDADSSRAILITNARGCGLFNLKFEDFGLKNWIAYERRKRMIWLLFEFDCTICTLTNSRPCMSLHDLNNNLPCDEDVWEGKKPWKDGPGFKKSIAEILSGHVGELSSYSKRMIAQALGRSIWDYVELESTIVFKSLGMSNSAQGQLLNSLDLLQGKSGDDEIVHVSMTSMIVCYSHIYSHQIIDLLTSATRDPEPTKIEKLLVLLDRDVCQTRYLAWQATQIFAIVRSHPIHSPCESMRVFMAGLYLFWFSKSTASTDHGTCIYRLDTPPWESPPPRRWIDDGGIACVRSGNELVKITGPDGDNAVIDVTINVLKGLMAWGLSDKFCTLLNNLRDMRLPPREETLFKQGV